jgi:transglutaminase-like putative cysteine protease
MKYSVTHTTRYRYSAPVSTCHNVGRLRLRKTPQQNCTRSQLIIDPAPAVSHQWQDLFGNQLDFFSIQQPHSELTVTARSEVNVVSPGTLLDRAFPTAWEQVRDYLRTASDDVQALEARQFVLESDFVVFSPQASEYSAASFSAGRPLLEAVEDLMRRIHRDFTYDPGFSDIATPLADVLAHRKGVCQDFAHLAIACLRSNGLAARYVSGYLETIPPPGSQRLVGSDASHAWFSVFVPYQGWVDFDPTNDQIPADRHITAAWGRDYADAAPLKGVLFGGGESHALEVAVDVVRL